MDLYDQLKQKQPQQPGQQGGDLAGVLGGQPQQPMQPAVQPPPDPMTAQSQQIQAAPQQPAQAPAQPAPAAGQPADPFQAMGGGVWTGQQWVPKDHPLARQAQTAQTGMSAPVAGQPGQPPTTVAGAFQQALLSKLTADPSQVSAQSPEISGAIQSGRLADQRALERQRGIAREQQVANGITGGGADAGLGAIEQQVREGQAMRESGLVGDLAKRKEAALMTALGLAGNQINAEEARALQRELGLGDLDVRRAGLGAQTALGQGDLALREKLGMGNLNLGLLGLLQGGDLAGKQMGLTAGIEGARLNQSALLGLLNGL